MFIENDFDLEVARGRVGKVETVTQFGKNMDVDVGAAEDIWNEGGLYTGFPAVAEQMEIFSGDTSSADSASGTGARTVRISKLLNAGYQEMPDVIVSLDGTTAVSLGSIEYLRGAGMDVVTAGSGGTNAGSLTLRHVTTTANIFAVVPIGRNSSNAMVMTVPDGKNFYIKSVSLGMVVPFGSTGWVDIALLHRPEGEVWRLLKYPGFGVGNIQYSGEYVKIDGRSDIKGHVFSISNSDAIVSASISGKMVDD